MKDSIWAKIYNARHCVSLLKSKHERVIDGPWYRKSIDWKTEEVEYPDIA